MAEQATLGKLLVELLLKDDQFLKGLKISEKALKQAGSKFDGFSKQVSGAFTKSIKIGTAALGAFGAASLIVGAGFEKQMAAVAAVKGITDLSSEAFQRLTDRARELGSTTAFSATQAAEGMEALGRAGLSTDQIIAASGTALQLAQAGQISLARSSEILAGSMAQFGIEAENVNEIADTFAVVAANSLFSVEGLSQAMKSAGPIAAGFGMTIDQTTQAVAQFRDLGVDASTAGTQFRETLAKAAKVSGEAEVRLAKLGLTAKDINPEFNSFEQIMRKLGEAGLGTTDAIEIFGKRAGSAVASISKRMTETGNAFDALGDKLIEKSGVAQSTAETMTNNVAGRFAILRSAMEELFLVFFDQFKGPLTEILTALISFIGKVSSELTGRTKEIGSSFEEIFGQIADFINKNADQGAKAFADFIQMALDTAKALGPLLMAVGSLAVALSTLTPILDELIILFATVWAATKVAVFTNAVFAAIPALAGLTTTVTAFGVSLTIATGGLVAIGAAIAVVVTGIGLLIARTIRARNETEALAQAQLQQAANITAAEAGVDRVLARKLTTTKALILEERRQLITAGKLTDEIRQQQDTILGLNAATAAQHFRSGNLINVGERLVTVQGALNRQGIEGKLRVLEQTKAMDAQIRTTQKQLETASGPLREKLLGKLEEQQNRLVNLTRHQLDSEEASKASADAVDGEAAAFTRLAKGMTLTSEQLESLAADRASAASATLDIMRGLEAELASIGADESTTARLQLEERISDINDAFDEEVRLNQSNAALVEQINDERNSALRLANAAHVAREGVRADDAAKDQAKKDADAADKSAKGRAKAEEKGSKLLTKLRRDSLTKVQQLEEEKFRALEDLTQASAETRAAIEAEFDQQIAAEKRRSIIGVFGDIGKAGVDAFNMVSGAISSSLGAVNGLVEGLTGVDLSFKGILASAMEITGLVQEARAAGAVGGVENKVATEAVDGMIDGAIAFVEQLVKAIPSIIQRFAERIPDLMQSVADALPELMQSLADAIPALINGIVESIPALVQGLVDSLPMLFDAILAAIPGLITAILDAVVTIIDVIPLLVRKLLKAIPGIITAILEAIPAIIRAIVRAIPKILDALIDNLPAIIQAVINGIPAVVLAVVRAVPKIIVSLVEAIPGLVGAVVDQIPLLITTIIGMIPTIIISLANALPDLLPAIILLIPKVAAEVIAALPEIAIALVTSIFEELILKMPDIVFALVAGILESVVEIGKQIGSAILSIIPGVGGKDKKNKKGGKGFDSDDSGFIKDIGEALGSLFKKGAASGIEFVPATMRTVLHPGEAVLTADQNRRRMQGGAPGPAAGGAFATGGGGGGGGGGGSPIEILVMAEGRLLDAVQVESMERGRATGVKRIIRRASGARVGFTKGRFNAWTT